MKILKFFLIAVLALGLCWSSGLAQDDYNVAGDYVDIECDVMLQNSKVALGQRVTGDCVVLDQADQTKYTFEIYRKDDQKGDVLVTTGSRFLFPVNTREEAENLYCKVTDQKGNHAEKNFALEVIAEPNLHVRWMTRNATSTALICELVPRPQSLALFRFRWLAPGGKQISNGPVALISTAQLHREGADGYICEGFHLKTRRQLKAGLQISPLRAIQAGAYFNLTVKKTQEIRSGQPLRIACNIYPQPSGPVSYSWMFNNNPVPGSDSIYITPPMSIRTAGNYTCIVNFSHNGQQKTLRGSENIHGQGSRNIPRAIDRERSHAGVMSPDRSVRPEAQILGSTVELHCEDPDNANIYNVFWTHNARPIDFQKYPREITTVPFVPNKSYVLEIQRLKPSHVGMYTCSYNANEPGGPRKQVYANIRAMPGASLHINPPTMEVSNDNEDNVGFHCTLQMPGSITNYNSSQIEWRYQPNVVYNTAQGWSTARRISNGQANFKIIQKTRLSSELTKLNGFTNSDVGHYLCSIPGSDVNVAIANLTAAPEEEIIFTDESTADEVCTLRCTAGGSCYEPQQVCDGKPDCPDGEDEANCQCDPALRICGTNRQGEPAKKKYYNVHWECDGENDCGNNYDEEDCSPHKKVAHCSSGGNQTMYRCKTGNMIPLAYVCDGSPDCSDSGDDEERCTRDTLSVRPVDASYRTLQDNTIVLYEGQSLNMQCEAAGKPGPRIVWRKQWRCLPGQADGQSQTPYKSDMPYGVNWVVESMAVCEPGMQKTQGSLKISSISKSDAGIYNCEALQGSMRALSTDFVVIVNPR